MGLVIRWWSVVRFFRFGIMKDRGMILFWGSCPITSSKNYHIYIFNFLIIFPHNSPQAAATAKTPQQPATHHNKTLPIQVTMKKKKKKKKIMEMIVVMMMFMMMRMLRRRKSEFVNKNIFNKYFETLINQIIFKINKNWNTKNLNKSNLSCIT